MSELQRCRDAVSAQANKFETESEFLFDQVERIESGNDSKDAVDLAVSQAKRVRRESNLFVRTLARLRDNLQPKEGTR